MATRPRKLAKPRPKATGKPARPPWYKDPNILARLERVEKLRLTGMTALRASEVLEMPYNTVRTDYRHLDELGMARLNQTTERLRAGIMRRLDNVITQAHVLLDEDRRYTEAVLFGMPVLVTCPGRQEHDTDEMLMKDRLSVNDRHATWGTRFTCLYPHTLERRVYRDEKGSAQYRRIGGQVIQALRATIMDQAKLAGLIVDKTAITDGEGTDLPTALKDILLGEHLTAREIRRLPSARPPDDLDVGIA